MSIVTFKKARTIKTGEYVIVPAEKYRWFPVLKIEYDTDSNNVFFHTTNGIYHHRAVISAKDLSMNDIVNRLIKDPKTRVYIKYNDELGYWRYSVVVHDSGDFWLDSFVTKEEAEEYVKTNKLKLVTE